MVSRLVKEEYEVVKVLLDSQKVVERIEWIFWEGKRIVGLMIIEGVK